MRITCPSCKAQYDVDDNAISFAGQDVQCSDCLTVWVQKRDGSVIVEPQTPADPMPEDTDESTVWMDEPPEATIPLDDIPSEIADFAGHDQQATEQPEIGSRQPLVSEKSDFEDLSGKLASLSARLGTDQTEDPEPEQDQEDSPVATSVTLPDDIDITATMQKIGAFVEANTIRQPVPVDDSTTGEKIEKPYNPDMPPIQEPVDLDPNELYSQPVNSEEPYPWESSVAQDNEPGADEAQTAEYVDEFDTDVGRNTAADQPVLFEDEIDNDDSENGEEPDVKLTLVSDNTTKLESKDTIEEDLLKTFRDQIEIEDELEKNFAPEDDDVELMPAELIGRRARVPDVDGLKHSIRARNVHATGDHLAFHKSRRRFRFGFILALFLFALLLGIYLFTDSIARAVPGASDYLNKYVEIVDTSRGYAANIGHLLVSWAQQGYDWAMTKISGLINTSA